MSSKSTSSMRAFWSRLQTSVHPDDEAVFRSYPEHSFNLRFPPPAFIGDIDTAPIVILMSNGGYKPGITEDEFPDDTAILDYRHFISGLTTKLPPLLARYYSIGQLGEWIHAGKAVLVNAVPYRSRKLSEEKYNRCVAEQLPSLAAHRHWVMNEVLPDAASSKRFVFVHRNGWWKIPESFAGPCVVFSDPTRAEPNRKAPDQAKLEFAQRWLLERSGTLGKSIS